MAFDQCSREGLRLPLIAFQRQSMVLRNLQCGMNHAY